MIFIQVSVDIFLIDWERPKQERDEPKEVKDANRKGANQNSVSIWRTYFVANEWNEIQTERRIMPVLQIFLLVLILEYFNVKNIATYDFGTSVNIASTDYRGATLPLFRFAICTAVYILLGKYLHYSNTNKQILCQNCIFY